MVVKNRNAQRGDRVSPQQVQKKTAWFSVVVYYLSAAAAGGVFFCNSNQGIRCVILGFAAFATLGWVCCAWRREMSRVGSLLMAAVYAYEVYAVLLVILDYQRRFPEAVFWVNK